MGAPVLEKKKWLIILPILLGLAILIILVKSRSGPEQAPLTEKTRAVRVIEVPSVTVIPRAVGYGNVEPGMVWEAVAEVSGKIIEIHPKLKKGAILGADTVLLRIDPTDYELAIARTETDIQATQAQLAELQVKEANTRASLKIEQETLGLSEKELERKRKLVAKGTVSRSTVEQEERTVLAQKQSVQSHKNSLNLYPVERKLLEAQLARHQAQLASAKLDLERTTLQLPFHGRIAQVNVERTQYVRQGDVLAVADSISVAEVAAQIPMGRMRALVRSQEIFSFANPSTVSLRRALGISAQVWLRGEGFSVKWPARLARLSDTLDPQTRTVGVIVEVDEPYGDIQPGIRPPLLKGLFVDVELRGKPRPDSLVIPRSALHDNEVYVVASENRLEKRVVQVDLVEPAFVSVSKGLQAGERVVISDLIPAIEGMLLSPALDPEALAVLLREAQGEGAPQ